MTLTRHNKVLEGLLKHFQFTFFLLYFFCIFIETFVLIVWQHPRCVYIWFESCGEGVVKGGLAKMSILF